VSFSRSDGLIVHGLDVKGNRFRIRQAGNKTWLSLSDESRNIGAFKESLGALWLMGGASVTTSAVIPAALMNIPSGLSFNSKEQAHLQGREQVNGVDCYKVTAISPISKKTFWVDSTSFLLQQLKEEVPSNNTNNALLFDGTPAEGKEDNSKPRPKRFSSTLLIFANSSVNKPIDKQFFVSHTPRQPAEAPAAEKSDATPR
jgi:hypothetical protein